MYNPSLQPTRSARANEARAGVPSLTLGAAEPGAVRLLHDMFKESEWR
jgi:hypothetical protein